MGQVSRPLFYVVAFCLVLTGCHHKVSSTSQNSSGRLSAAEQATKNPWWPLVPGNSWTFKKSDNGHPLTITVEPSQPTFGCGDNPIHLYFQKTDADAYWGPGASMNLHWFLGVQANGNVMGYGHWVSDLQGNPQGDTMNYKSMNSSIPAYFLIPGNVTDGQSVSNRHALPTAHGITNECIPDDKNYYSTWNVIWNLTTVSVPAYSGPALVAHYDEQTGGGRQIEDWYFAQGIGVVRIVAKNIDGTPAVDMQLSSYRLNDVTTISSGGTTTTNPVIPSVQFNVGTTPNPAPSSTNVITVSVGQHLYYSWNSNGVSLSSFYVSNGPDNCPGGFSAGDTEKPWVAMTPSGSSDAVIQSCQAGHTYYLTVQAVSSTGNVTPASFEIIVSPTQMEPAPVAYLSLSNFAHVTTQTYNVNDTVNYSWNAENGSVQSYYFASAPDTCPGGFGPMDVTKPWIITTTGQSGTSAMAQNCQAARTYTMDLVVTSPSGLQVARDQVIVTIKGNTYQQLQAFSSFEPETWDVWDYWYNQLVGQPPPPLGNLVPNVDPNKRFLPMPLDTFWDCVTMNNCTAMINFYAPSPTGPTPTPMPSPTAQPTSTPMPTPPPSTTSPSLNAGGAVYDGVGTNDGVYYLAFGSLYGQNLGSGGASVTLNCNGMNISTAITYESPSQINYSFLPRVSTQTCSVMATVNGQSTGQESMTVSADTTLYAQMVNLAASVNPLDFDQWNYYYNHATGQAGADPTSSSVLMCLQQKIPGYSDRSTPMNWGIWCSCMNAGGYAISCAY